MAKIDIWFPLFIGDYLADTMHLDTREHGAYLLLLCAYYKNGGPLADDDKAFAAITRQTVGEWKRMRPVIQAFFVLEGNTWKQNRADEEIREREGAKAGRSRAASETNRKRWSKASDTVTDPVSESVSESLTESLSDTVTDPVSDPGANRSGVATCARVPHSHPQLAEREHAGEAEVLLRADRIGLAAWKALDWFQEMEACGWTDHNHRPIEKWQAALDRVKTKWEADGRPSGPPTANGNGRQNYGKNGAGNSDNRRNAGTYKPAGDYGEAARRKSVTSDAAIQSRVANEMAGNEPASPQAAGHGG